MDDELTYDENEDVYRDRKSTAYCRCCWIENGSRVDLTKDPSGRWYCTIHKHYCRNRGADEDIFDPPSL